MGLCRETYPDMVNGQILVEDPVMGLILVPDPASDLDLDLALDLALARGMDPVHGMDMDPGHRLVRRWIAVPYCVVYTSVCNIT